MIWKRRPHPFNGFRRISLTQPGNYNSFATIRHRKAPMLYKGFPKASFLLNFKLRDYFNFIYRQYLHHIETSQSSLTTKQLKGFCMIERLPLFGLISMNSSFKVTTCYLLCFKYELNTNCCIGKQNWYGIGLVKGLFVKKYFAESSEILSSQSIKLKYLSSVHLLLLFEINLQSVRNCFPSMYSCNLATSNFSRNSLNSFSWLSKTAIIENMITLKTNYFGVFLKLNATFCFTK